MASTSASEQIFQHNVFLNYRGPDTKEQFLLPLIKTLHEAGIERPFLDQQGVHRGQRVFQVIDEALDSARIHIAVFSSHYAQSPYCLNELQHMLRTGRPIIPVFYDVKPEHVRRPRNASGPFEEAFRKHLERQTPADVVEGWVAAMEKAAGLWGFERDSLKYRGNDELLIKDIVDDIVKLLCPTTITIQPRLGQYDWSEHYKLPMKGQGIILFAADTYKDLHIAFSPKAGMVYPSYEIVIGLQDSSQHTRSEIRRLMPDKIVCSYSPMNLTNYTLQEGNLHHFWICVDAKAQLIYVGRGQDLQEKHAFIIFKDPSFLESIQYFALSSNQVAITYIGIRMERTRPTLFGNSGQDSSAGLWSSIDASQVLPPSRDVNFSESTHTYGDYNWSTAYKPQTISPKPQTTDRMYEMVIGERDNSSSSIQKKKILSRKGPSSLPEVPTTDLIVYGMDKPHLCLDIAHKCWERVQKMPSRKFNNEQCGYLVAKLEVILTSAYKNLADVKFSSPGDFARCIEVFKLLLALALKIESFIQGCCENEWLQAAMTLTNTAEYVSSLGFNLELCEVYFSMRWTATKALTAAQVDRIDRNEVEIVKRKASLDVDVLLDKVILEMPALQAEDKDLAIYLLQRLKRVKPASTSHSPESPFLSAFDDWGFLGRIFQMVRQTELLGKGTSATVHKAVWLGTLVAKKTFYGPENPDYLTEAQILGGLCHPNIMSMFCCAMDKRKCSIVMELMDEDLHSFMQRRLEANPHSPPFSVFEAVDVILQIGEGVNYLHQNGIVHRDLKSFNILLKNVLPTNLEVQYVLIKVADFGFAKIKESSTRYSNQTSNIGTNRWMPPEVMTFPNNDGQSSTSVLSAGPKYPKKSDVYSFGMVCYEILTGDVPFPQEPSLVNIKKKVLKGERPPLPDYCPSILKALIEACWDPEPIHRPSFASICSSVKHLKCLLMSGFNSSEDSHVKIGGPLSIAPGDISSELEEENGSAASPKEVLRMALEKMESS